MRYTGFVDLSARQVPRIVSDLAFVARAVSDDQTRYFMNFLVIEELSTEESPAPKIRAVATDGRHLHWAEIPADAAVKAGISPGHWKVIRVTATRIQLAKCDPDCTEVGKFPNYSKVIPSGDPDFTTDFYGFKGRGTAYRDVENLQRMAKLLRDFPEPTLLNFGYLEDLGMDAVWKMEWRKGEGHAGAVCFRSGGRLAVIMPMTWMDAIRKAS